MCPYLSIHPSPYDFFLFSHMSLTPIFLVPISCFSSLFLLLTLSLSPPTPLPQSVLSSLLSPNTHHCEKDMRTFISSPTITTPTSSTPRYARPPISSSISISFSLKLVYLCGLLLGCFFSLFPTTPFAFTKS